MNAIFSLLAPFWQEIAGGLAVILGALGLYLKGRSDAGQKAKLDDLRTANDIRKQGAAARAGAAVDPDRLHQSDGWRRD